MCRVGGGGRRWRRRRKEEEEEEEEAAGGGGGGGGGGGRGGGGGGTAPKVRTPHKHVENKQTCLGQTWLHSNTNAFTGRKHPKYSAVLKAGKGSQNQNWLTTSMVALTPREPQAEDAGEPIHRPVPLLRTQDQPGQHPN